MIVKLSKVNCFFKKYLAFAYIDFVIMKLSYEVSYSLRRSN
jgi:hypothetical protein